MIKSTNKDIEKNRLDSILVKLGYFKTRQKAKYAIDNKNIYVNDILVEKSSKIISSEDKIEIRGEILSFVSKGGLKLEKAINEFKINLNNKICIDIGASTGGFTDCMLQNKAIKVYAIDVGHDQLDSSLLNNKKVVNMEGTNIKEIDKDKFENIDFISADVSFISITQVLPKIYSLLKIKGKSVILVKPQFEVGKSNLSKLGVVRDIKLHKKTIQNILILSNNMGFKIIDMTYSPIKGPAGNIEYLIYLEKNQDKTIDNFEIKDKIEKITTEAFKKLK